MICRTSLKKQDLGFFRMDKVLIVEDSRLVCELLSRSIRDRAGMECVVAYDMASAKIILQRESENFFIALLDLRLPDATPSQIVDLVHSYDIPTVVFTGSLDEQIREMILGKGVVDYIYKKNQTDIDYIIRLVKRIRNNRAIKVLIVDDSSVFRLFIRQLLEQHCLNVLEATSGEEALSILRSNRDIMLALVDYNMPVMDGVEFISAVRSFRSRDQLGIIGLSASGDEVSVKLLKAGANDFLKKPFLTEELNCRVMQNLEYVEHIAEIREASLRDYLTGLYNRRFFFQVGERFFQSAKRKNTGMILAMVDIDYFKKINDTYGHQAGDEALKHVAAIFEKNMRSGDIVARYGGEEFAILACHVDEVSQAFDTFDRLRRQIEESPLDYDGQIIKMTASIGVSVELGDAFSSMVERADQLLYAAKHGGRNRVMLEQAGVSEE